MLKEIIDQYYSDKEKDYRQIRFYVTDAGKCSRQVFFKFKQAPREKMEARILRVFEHGDYIHQLIMKALFGSKDIRVVASEIDMPPQDIVSGRADAILSYNNELYVLDIKSMNSMVFKNLTEPKQENILQLQLYLHFFKVKKGILLYIDKDQQNLKEFIIEYDPVLSQKLLREFKILQEKIDSDILPPVLPDYPRNWQCSYCPYKAVCDLAGRYEISWSEFKNKIQQEQGEV